MQTQKTVLIVDDEKPIQYALTALLEGWGYVCVAVSSGQEALETVTRLEFDLILLDVRMPGISGLEFLKRFRADNTRTSVIMLTAVLDKKLTAEAMKFGADDFVIKPCKPADISKRLQIAYERRQQARTGAPGPGRKQLEYSEVAKDHNVRKDGTLQEPQGDPLSKLPDLFQNKKRNYTTSKEEIDEIRNKQRYQGNPWKQRGWDIP